MINKYTYVAFCAFMLTGTLLIISQILEGIVFLVLAVLVDNIDTRILIRHLKDDKENDNHE